MSDKKDPKFARDGKEPVAFWWKVQIFEPFLRCVPIYKETEKSVQIYDDFGKEFRMFRKDGSQVAFFHLAKDAVSWIRAIFRDRIEKSEEMTRFAYSRQKTMEEMIAPIVAKEIAKPLEEVDDE